jgi:hypothetical protein
MHSGFCLRVLALRREHTELPIFAVSIYLTMIFYLPQHLVRTGGTRGQRAYLLTRPPPPPPPPPPLLLLLLLQLSAGRTVADSKVVGGMDSAALALQHCWCQPLRTSPAPFH